MTKRITLQSGRGPIEIEWDGGGFEKLTNARAYFKADDMLAEIAPDGTFRHPYTGTLYRFSPPLAHTKHPTARLEVNEWRTVSERPVCPKCAATELLRFVDTDPFTYECRECRHKWQ